MTTTTETLPTAKPTTTRTRPKRRHLGKKIFITAFVLLLLGIFLLPFLNMLFIAFSTNEQIVAQGAPEWPAKSETLTYQGKELDVYLVPAENGETQKLAMLKPGRKQSTFIDVENPDAGEIKWTGNWREPERPSTSAPTTENFTEAWKQINFPRLFFNTLALAVIGIIGTVISCTLVAYGFSRFRFPGRDFLFIVLIRPSSCLRP